MLLDFFLLRKIMIIPLFFSFWILIFHGSFFNVSQNEMPYFDKLISLLLYRRVSVPGFFRNNRLEKIPSS